MYIFYYFNFVLFVLKAINIIIIKKILLLYTLPNTNFPSCGAPLYEPGYSTLQTTRSNKHVGPLRP